MALDGFFDDNRRNWDDRAPLHADATTGYRLDRYRDDRSLLSGVVAFDRPDLGDLTGLRVLHLQCHIGTDTLSLARLGAEVTGLDISPNSLAAARALFASVDTPGTFVEANTYDAVDALGGALDGALESAAFDLVYTGVGALNWLPDIARWADTVARLLAPGGRIHLREGHPMLYAFDEERDDGALVATHAYFETVEPLTTDWEHTYVDTGGVRIDATTMHEWNHGIGEVFAALTSAGLIVTRFDEHRFLDWKALPQMIPATPDVFDDRPGADVDGLWMLPDHQRDIIPLQYTLQATKPT